MAQGTCSDPDCRLPSESRGLCSSHHKFAISRGLLLPVQRTLVETYWPRIAKQPDGCWHWTGEVAADGYGRIWHRLAHRVMWEILIGPIEEGLDLDHMCHNRDRLCPGGSACIHRRCVNPSRFVRSAIDLADRPDEIEFVIVMDDDDRSYDGWTPPVPVIIMSSVRKTLALYYNDAQALAAGPIYLLGSDDEIIRTQGWDTKVLAAFECYPDRIVNVFADDGSPRPDKDFAIIPFLHQNWIDAVGRYLPPYFSGDFVDTWLNDVADQLGRKHKLDVTIEHMHPAWGKAVEDATYAEKWVKHFRDDMPQKYLDTQWERDAEVEKLRAVIDKAQAGE